MKTRYIFIGRNLRTEHDDLEHVATYLSDDGRILLKEWAEAAAPGDVLLLNKGDDIPDMLFVTSTMAKFESLGVVTETRFVISEATLSTKRKAVTSKKKGR